MVPSATSARSAISETRLLWNPFSAMTAMAASRIRWYLSPTRLPFTLLGTFRPGDSGANADFDLSACLLCAIVSQNFALYWVFRAISKGLWFDGAEFWEDRKSTRLNSSHLVISYAVFCLKKKKSKHVTVLH